MTITPRERLAPKTSASDLVPVSTDHLTESFRIAEIRQLVALMNTTDLIEIVIDRPEIGQHLALRRKMEMVAELPAGALLSSSETPLAKTENDGQAETPKPVAVTASLVGRYRAALKSGQKPLVKIGDVVHEGQIVGGIETLHVMNEVEATTAGKVVDILVKSGDPVQYGQELLLIVPE
jgi:acetyl-CoA carboxylase biotin carboxyl carrier protein